MKLETPAVSACGWFSLYGIIGSPLISLYGVVVWEYETMFNTKNFIINSKLTALCNCNHSTVLNIYTYASNCLLKGGVKMSDTQTCNTHAWSRVHKHTSLGAPLLVTFRTAFIACTHKEWSTGDSVDVDRHTNTLIPTLDCLHKHSYTSWRIPLSRLQERFPCMQRYTQIAYLCSHCGTSLLGRDGRITNCIVKHPGVEAPFYSLWAKRISGGSFFSRGEVVTYNANLSGVESLNPCYFHHFGGISLTNLQPHCNLHIYNETDYGGKIFWVYWYLLNEAIIGMHF